MRLKKTLVLLSLGIAIAGCDASADSNPLVGKWKAISAYGGGTCMIDRLEFTARTQMLHTIANNGSPEYSQTQPVTFDFKTDPKLAFVYVDGNLSRGMGYALIDANTIQMQDGGYCTYKRGG